jgi:carbonic anhydrase
MKALLDGLRQFQRHALPKKRELFKRLAEGQHPHTLFVGCSDSRVDPNLILSTEPGDLFVLRNAGNAVPAYGAGNGGEAATVEFAVQVLGVSQVLVCGHSHCGAIEALIEKDTVADLPALRGWLRQFEAARGIVSGRSADVDPGVMVQAAIQENVLAQMANLKTHPTVADRMQAGALQLIGCMYWIESGAIAHTVANDRGEYNWVTISPED